MPGLCLHHTLSVQGILKPAHSLYQYPMRIFPNPAPAFLQCAAPGRTAPVFSIHMAAIPAAHLPHLRQKPDRIHIQTPHIKPSGIAGQAAVGSNHPMTGNHDRNRVVGHSAAYRLRRHPPLQSFPGPFGNCSVGSHLTIGNAAKLLPYHLPKFSAHRFERQLCGIRSLSFKIPGKPLFRHVKNRQSFLRIQLVQKSGSKIFLPLYPKTGNIFSVAGNCQLSHRRSVKCGIKHVSSLHFQKNL